MSAAAAPDSLTQARLGVPQDQCDVVTRRDLASYRDLYAKWMTWYEHAPDRPNTIEGQIGNMMFYDLTYRSRVTHLPLKRESHSPIRWLTSSMADIWRTRRWRSLSLWTTEVTLSQSGGC